MTSSSENESSCSSEALVPDEYLCPLTLTLMNDPVISKFGHSYERVAILKWLIEHQSCPMTRQSLRLSDLITNHQLRARIRNWQVEFGQDITILCPAADFQDRTVGLYILPDLEDTERSEDDDDDNYFTTSERSQAPNRSAPSQSQPRHRYSHRRVTRSSRQQRPSASYSSNSENRSSSLNSFTRRLFGRSAGAAA